MLPLVSVIVPVYNVEKYLQKCVDSITNQTYRNLEIILVDDESPDNCPKICDDYSKKDNRIKVIHKNNGGLSDARNAGMKIATGEYISFIDSDDYVSKEFIEVLYNALQSEDGDIAECDKISVNFGESPAELNEDNKVTTYNGERALSLLIAENGFRQHVWNKLYKSEIALQIPFEKGKLNEDEFWTYQVFGKADKVTKINRSMYYYLQRDGSIMGNTFSIKRLDALEAKQQRQKYMENNFPNLALQAKIDFYGSCMFAMQSALKFMKSKEKIQAVKIINEYRKDAKLSFNEIKSIRDSSKKWYYFAKINFYLCSMFRAVSGIGF